MKARLWRAVALAVCVFGLFMVVDDVVASFFNSTIGARVTPVDASHIDEFRVVSIKDPSTAVPPLHAGDRLRLHDDSFMHRLAYNRGRVGDSFEFDRVSASGVHDTVTMTYAPAPAIPVSFVYVVVRLALLVVAMIVAVRRPDRPEARALVEMFLALVIALHINTSPWAPPIYLAFTSLIGLVCNIWAAYAALELACTFPQVATGGPRRWLRVANRFLAVTLLLTGLTAWWSVYVRERIIAPLSALNLALTGLYFVLITVAFVTAMREARGAERRRVAWVAWTLAVAFSGSLVTIALIALHVPLASWMAFLGLTLLAAPFGLGYAIVRHKVVDIGFVVNRALVFGIISTIVVVAFGAVEWLLGNVFVKVSHITSTSLELGVALVLGFSLRTIHGRVDKLVDDVFFRDRHEAERALRTFARDVHFIADPAVALARAHAEIVTRSGATGGAIYLVHGAYAARVDPGEDAAPRQLSIDDPALVRMRATREAVAPRMLGSALGAELDFPMFVRGALLGFVAIGPKRSGEAYAPDERDTIAAVAHALGVALDAAQTEALKRQIARVVVDGAPVDDLRRAWDGNGLVRAATPQPAGPIPRLAE